MPGREERVSLQLRVPPSPVRPRPLMKMIKEILQSEASSIAATMWGRRETNQMMVIPEKTRIRRVMFVLSLLCVNLLVCDELPCVTVSFNFRGTAPTAVVNFITFF